jgi:hypothetical protein
MTFQTINAAETEPGAIVSSSLITRLKENQVLAWETLTVRAVGDIVLARGAGDTGIGGTVTGTYTTGFSGGLRFKIAKTDMVVNIQRNGLDVETDVDGTVDITGWSRGDEITIVGTGSGISATLSFEICADAPFGLNGDVVITGGA